MFSIHGSSGGKPQYFWDEGAGLLEDKPYYLKLISTDQQRELMPSKNPAMFGFTVGYTLPFNWDCHSVQWHVIPATCELQHSQLVFVPMPKRSPLTKVNPPKPEKDDEEAMPPRKGKKGERPVPKDEPLPSNQPSYRVAYMPLPLNNKSRPAITVGVTFPTQHGNHRVVWDVMPSPDALAKGWLLLDTSIREGGPLPDDSSFLQRVLSAF